MNSVDTQHTDKTTKTRKRIPLKAEHEVAYLALVLNCSEEQVHEALSRVGNNKFLIRRYIQDKWHTA